MTLLLQLHRLYLQARRALAGNALQLTLVLSVVVGISVPIWLGIIYHRQQFEEQLFERQQREMVQIGDFLSLSLREPLWQRDTDAVRSILSAALGNENILSVELTDMFGETYKSARPQTSRSLGLAPTQPVVYAETIRRNHAGIGLLVVTTNDLGYYRELNEFIRTQIQTGVAIFIASVLLILWVLRVRLVAPVRGLIEASESLSTGDLLSPILAPRRDEIGRLALSLNRTRIALSRLFDDLDQRNLELGQLNAELESRVSARTAELRGALASLQAAQKDAIEKETLASLGRIVAGVAHELNTPIGNAVTVASTLTELLARVEAEINQGTVRKSSLVLLSSEGQAGLHILLKNLGRAATLIQDFKQVAVDQTTEQRRSFDAAEVIANVLVVSAPQFKRFPHQLHTDLATGLVCDSYPGPLGHVVTQLVHNAMLHAFGEGTQGEVWVRLVALPGGLAELSVADNGIGMSAEIQQHIFAPFFTTRFGQGGSGLGLNVVLGYVSRVLEGQIEVWSEPDRGTRVTVRFPCVAPPGRSPAPQPLHHPGVQRNAQQDVQRKGDTQ